MKSKFLLKTVGITTAVAMAIGGIGVYNYSLDAATGTTLGVKSNSVSENTAYSVKSVKDNEDKPEHKNAESTVKYVADNKLLQERLKRKRLCIFSQMQRVKSRTLS